LFCNYF